MKGINKKPSTRTFKQTQNNGHQSSLLGLGAGYRCMSLRYLQNFEADCQPKQLAGIIAPDMQIAET